MQQQRGSEPDPDDVSEVPAAAPAAASEPTAPAGSEPAPAAATTEPQPAAPAISEPEPAAAVSTTHTRRWFLAGGAAVLAGAGAGVAAGFARHRPRPTPNPPPAQLLAARAVEARLLAAVDATAHADPASAQRLHQLRADHRAHLSVIDAALARFDRPSPAARRRAEAATASGAVPRTLAALQRAEAAAAGAAAQRASHFAPDRPALATVFASIAASESTHAELLT